MQKKFFILVLGAFALMGAGCARTPSPKVLAPTAKEIPAARSSTTPPQALAPEPTVTAPAPKTEFPVIPAPTPKKESAEAPPPTAMPKSVAPAPVVEAPAPATHAVTIQNFAYAPATLTIKAGDTVVWTQKDSAPHTVTSDSGSELNSAVLSPDQTFAHTFTTKGTFNYHCAPHPFMKATVVVE